MELREYINEVLSAGLFSDEVHGVKYNHSFTDRNGVRHEDGYKPKDKNSLKKLLSVLIKE